MKLELFHQPSNTCGSCTLCCKVLAIAELSKPKDTYCPHAVSKQGCSIYESRPESCRQFTCVWLNQNLQPEYRPDRIHGVLDTTVDGQHFIIHEDPGYPGFATEALKDFTSKITASGTRFVIIVRGSFRRLIARADFAKRIRFGKNELNGENEIFVDEVHVEEAKK